MFQDLNLTPAEKNQLIGRDLYIRNQYKNIPERITKCTDEIFLAKLLSGYWAICIFSDFRTFYCIVETHPKLENVLQYFNIPGYYHVPELPTWIKIS